MTRFIFVVVGLSSILNCNSPMNNRVAEQQQTQQKAQSIQFQNFPLRVETRWNVGPIGNLEKNNHLLVFLKDANGNPASLPQGLTLEFYSRMPSMEHPLIDAGYFEKISEGIYLNPYIKFNMAGDWEHTLSIQDENYDIKDKIQWLEFF